MGSSITVPGETGGGTLGGLFTLTSGEITHRGFLTNFHVIRPAEKESEIVKATASRYGSSLSCDSADRTRCEVLYFAPKDVEATQQETTSYLAELTDRLQRLQDQKKMWTLSMARIPPGLLVQIDQAERLMATSREKSEAIQAMPKALGKILVSSGKALLSRRIMDWAFIALHDQVDPSFTPNKMPDIPNSQKPGKYGLNLMAEGGQELTTFGQLVKGEYYVKVGRATGLTEGVCNGTKAYCNWGPKDLIRFDEEGNEVSSETTEEFVVVRMSGSANLLHQDVFCRPGDSGSLLINRYGEVCGLLFGASKGWCGPPGQEEYHCYAGLAMTMPELMKSLEAKTNGAILGLS